MNIKNKAEIVFCLFFILCISGMVMGALTPVPISTILAGVNFTVVYAFNASSQAYMSYTPDMPEFATVTQMIPGQQGYWIYSNENKTVQINGTEISSSDYGGSIKTGWNLVGYAKTTPTSIGTLLSGLNYTVVYGFNASSQSYASYTPDMPEFATVTTMEAGKGYWIYANTNATWTYT